MTSREWTATLQIPGAEALLPDDLYAFHPEEAFWYQEWWLGSHTIRLNHDTGRVYMHLYHHSAYPHGVTDGCLIDIDYSSSDGWREEV